MDVKKEIIVNKPVDQAWDLLGKQYTQAYKWARGLYHSEGFGAPKLKGATCNNRTCDTSFGKIKEEIRVFDEENFELAYEVIEGFPGFIKKGINNWKLEPLSNRKTKVTMHFVGETQGVMGVLMGPMMGLKLSSTLSEALEDFKAYLETGKPSDGKLKDMRKHAKKAA